MLVCVFGFRVEGENEANLPVLFLLTISSHHALNNHALGLLVKNESLLCVWDDGLGERLKVQFGVRWGVTMIEVGDVSQ
jgi:hypothetical protein